ncbi:hypothetical protein BT96DRAFT_168659 [Gymnopus androsaceus JB14]|uniref:Uncharacterized protein n=1 Tax=Gymnopus androsaceus JB14 TaxID=1447944 RepID=A0A6A4HB49_9AGAR|nr:hypothetical protein BT96DRAFT_168659 [Gymnopus androsaceus JB14]
MNYFRLLSSIEHHVSLRRGRYISPRIVSEFYFVLSIMCRRGGEEYMQMCISPPIISNFYFVWSLRREEYMQQPAPHCQDRFTLHTLAISLPFIWTLGRSNNWAFSMNALILLLQSFSLLLIILGPIHIPDDNNIGQTVIIHLRIALLPYGEQILPGKDIVVLRIFFPNGTCHLF